VNSSYEIENNDDGKTFLGVLNAYVIFFSLLKYSYNHYPLIHNLLFFKIINGSIYIYINQFNYHLIMKV
jgi:uncharacterized membrane protein